MPRQRQIPQNVLNSLQQGQFPQQFYDILGPRSLFGGDNTSVFQHIMTPGGPVPARSLSPDVLGILNDPQQFFNLINAGNIGMGGGINQTPQFNFNPNLLPQLTGDPSWSNATTANDPQGMFDILRRFGFVNPPPVSTPSQPAQPGLPNQPPGPTPPNQPPTPPPGPTPPPAGSPPPGASPPPTGPPTGKGGPDNPFGPQPDLPDSGGWPPWLDPSIGGGFWPGLGGGDTPVNPHERIDQLRQFFRRFFPYFPGGGGGGGTPPYQTPPFNPDAEGPPNIGGTDSPGFGMPNPFGSPPFPSGFRSSPTDFPGTEEQLGEAGSRSMKELILQGMESLRGVLDNSLTMGDPILHALLQSAPGMIPSPEAFHMATGGLFGQSPYTNALGGAGIQGQLQNFLNQGPIGSDLFGNLVQNAWGLGGPMLEGASTGLQHILENGLPGQQRLQDQMLANLGMAQQIQDNPNNFLTSLNQMFSEGLPSAFPISRNIGASQNLLDALYDPSMPTGNVAGPARFLNSMFRYGIPGQQGDISDRGGIEGLQGYLTNLGRGGLEDAFEAVQGLGKARGLDENLFERARQFSENAGQGGPVGFQPLDPNQVPGLNVPTVGSPNIQGTTEDALTGLIQGGGISPDFVRAQTERILEPMQDQLLGRLNQMTGGVGNLGSSGSVQDALAEQSSDFMNDLISQGFRNFNTSIGQGIGLGGQQFGQDLSNVRNQIAGEQFDIGNLQNILQTNQQLGQQAGQFGAGQGLRELDLLRSLQGQQFGQESQFANMLSGLGQFGAGQAPNVMSNIMNTALAPVGAWGNLTNQVSNQGLGGFNALTGQTLNTIGAGSNIFNQLQNQAMQQFGAVPQNVLPFLQTGLNTGLGLGQFGLNASLGIDQNMLQRLGGIQNLQFQPQQMQDQRMAQAMNQLTQMFGLGQGAYNQIQGFGLDVNRLGQNPLLALLNYDAQRLAAQSNRPSPWELLAQALF